MAAFITSFLVAIAGCLGIYLYSKRRPVGAPLSWGEAAVAATFAFGLMFWCYGVVPHQFLTWTSNELNWRSDKFLVGPQLPFSGEEGLFEYFLPFSLNWEVVSHVLVVGIYGLFLAAHVAAWAIWQDRAKPKAEVVPTSEYGRPLVRQQR